MDNKGHGYTGLLGLIQLAFWVVVGLWCAGGAGLVWLYFRMFK
jgi:hypothetical protein